MFGLNIAIKLLEKAILETGIMSRGMYFGAYVWIIGLPVDLLVGYKGHTFLVEIKTDSKKRLTKLQADFFENWSGSTLARIDSPEAALRMIGVVK